MRTAEPLLDNWIGQTIGVARPTLADVRAYQLGRIRAVLDYAFLHAPFYRALHKTPPMPRSFAEFERLPVVGAADLVRSGGRMLCVPQDEVARVVTSGTTAEPKRLYFTQAELDRTVDYFTEGSRQFIRAGEKTLLLFPCAAESGAARLFMRALARLGAAAVPYGVPKDGAEACRVLRAERPDLVLAAPQTAVQMRAASDGTERFDTLLLSGDGMAEAEIAAQRARFCCDVFLQYGLTETAFGLGVDCRAFAGYHLREADFYVEILDQNNKTLPHGAYGRVVITSLHCGAMPLIRYDTGDVSRFLPAPCGCGSAFPLLDRIRPRNVPKGYRAGG